MNITTYAESHRSKFKSPKADILERWQNRIVAQSLHTAGRAGAQDYLSRYGKGISAAKVTALALTAEFQGFPEMAAGFWENAFFLETGKSEAYAADGKAAASSPTIVPTSRKAERVQIEGLPEVFQPGSIATMQPTDAPKPQSSYVVDPAYLGQPKRDGHRNVVFASADLVAHQSRSTSVVPTFATAFDEAAKKAAAEIGSFVLDGEKVYLNADGGEHRTAAQAATMNVSLGKGEVRPVILFSAFKALFHKASLLEASEIDRIKAGVVIVEAIRRHLADEGIIVEATPTAITTSEKAKLVEEQKANDREGEVWTLVNCTYTGGKDHKIATVRTKDVIEVTTIITGVNYSKAAGRTIGSFDVSDLNGKPIGSVGSGFDEQSALKLAAEHEANPGTVRIEVRCQKFTEQGQLWHPRMA